MPRDGPYELDVIIFSIFELAMTKLKGPRVKIFLHSSCCIYMYTDVKEIYTFHQWSISFNLILTSVTFLTAVVF